MIRPGISWVLASQLLLFTLLCFLFKSNGESTPYVATSLEQMNSSSDSTTYAQQLFCQFFTQTCAWNGTDEIKYHDGKSTSLGLEGPLNDRGFSSNIVFYLGVNGSTTPEEFTSPPFKAPHKEAECFHFRFYSMIQGGLHDGLHLYLIDLESNKATEIWSRSSIDIDRWISEQVDIVSNNSYRMMFRAAGSGGFVALQDFAIHDHFCENRECDFETNLCRGWTMQAFQLTKASKSAFENRMDHTTRSGFGNFAYINLKEHKAHQEIPITIEGPEMKDLGTQCFSFSFMRSDSDFLFNLVLKTFDGKDFNTTILWQSNSSHLSIEWMTVRHTLKRDSVYARHTNQNVELEACNKRGSTSSNLANSMNTIACNLKV